MKTTKLTLAIILLAAIAAGQNRQNQRTVVNSNNNNSNSHNITASGGAGGNADSTSSGGTSSSGGNSQSTSTDYERQTFSAIAPPAFHSSPCVKGWGGAAQAPVAGLSIGAGKIDKGCDIRETASEFKDAGSLVSFCKMMVTEPNAKKAGVTFQDCMTIVPPEKIAEESPDRPEPVAAVQPPQIIVPAPVVTVNVPPTPIATPVLVPPPPIPVKHHSTHKVDKDCPTLEK
jgi:hypothetical protein